MSFVACDLKVVSNAPKLGLTAVVGGAMIVRGSSERAKLTLAKSNLGEMMHARKSDF